MRSFGKRPATRSTRSDRPLLELRSRRRFTEAKTVDNRAARLRIFPLPVAALLYLPGEGRHRHRAMTTVLRPKSVGAIQIDRELGRLRLALTFFVDKLRE